MIKNTSVKVFHRYLLTEALHEHTEVKIFVISLLQVLERIRGRDGPCVAFLQEFACGSCGAMQTISLAPKCTLWV